MKTTLALFLAALGLTGTAHGNPADLAVRGPSGSPVACLPPPPLGELDLSVLKGKTVAQVTRLLEAKGITVRIVSEDGAWFPVTTDLRPNRVNLHIQKGIVVGADIG